MQCSRLLYPFAWLPTSAKHHGQKVTRLSDFENGKFYLSGDKNAEFVQADHCLRDKHFANKHRQRHAVRRISCKLSLIG